jgi:hypothetical protein
MPSARLKETIEDAVPCRRRRVRRVQEPTMSVNNTVTCLRSPLSARRVVRDALDQMPGV